MGIRKDRQPSLTLVTKEKKGVYGWEKLPYNRRREDTTNQRSHRSTERSLLKAIPTTFIVKRGTAPTTLGRKKKNPRLVKKTCTSRGINGFLFLSPDLGSVGPTWEKGESAQNENTNIGRADGQHLRWKTQKL